MDRENMRVTISKRMMKEGLLRCLAEKNIDRISVSELCREAGVNRATFYKHYQTPNDILVDIGWDHAKEIKRRFEADKRTPIKERMTRCFSYLYDNREMMKVLFGTNADQYLAETAADIFAWAWEQIVDLRKRMELDDLEYRLAATSYGYAAYYLIRQWIVEDIEKTPAEITELFIKLPGRNIYG